MYESLLVVLSTFFLVTIGPHRKLFPILSPSIPHGVLVGVAST
jgi:hypothetical protein